MTFRSPHATRRPVPYQLDYSSDSDTRYLHERGGDAPYVRPPPPRAGYDPSVIKAFQEEIERTHPAYVNTRHKHHGQAGGRSLSPERYSSDSEIMTMYRLRDRTSSSSSSKEAYLSQLVDVEDRCNSLPQMDMGDSSDELKHWLKKFDNLSFELQRQDGVPGSAAQPVPTTGELTYNMLLCSL